MPLQPTPAQQLRQHIHNSDMRTATAYGELSPLLASRFIDPSHAASEIATSISINGYEETLDKLTLEPQRFGFLNDVQDWEVSTVIPALEAYNAALEDYWQACDQLELEGYNRSREDFAER